VLTTGDGGNKVCYYQLLDHTKNSRTGRSSTAISADQGLLYQWVKYEEKESLDFIFHDSIQNWGDCVADHRESGASQFKGASDVF
jgi:hypothetical protein